MRTNARKLRLGECGIQAMHTFWPELPTRETLARFTRSRAFQPLKTKTPAGDSLRALTKTFTTSMNLSLKQNIATPNGRTMVSKRIAISRYLSGHLSLEKTQSLFDKNPNWRGA